MENDYKIWFDRAISNFKLSKYKDVPIEIKEITILNDYAVQTRYPGDYTPINADEYNNAVIITEKCIEWVEKKIKNLKATGF